MFLCLLVIAFMFVFFLLVTFCSFFVDFRVVFFSSRRRHTICALVTGVQPCALPILRLGPYTVLGTNVRVRANADLERVVVHDNSYLGEGVRLRGATIGRSCDLRGGVRAEEGVVLGDECFVGEQAVLAAGVKVYPFKTVEAGAVINSSIVWESRGSRSLFGRVGVGSEEHTS